MGALHLSRLWSMVSGMELLMGLLWLGLAAFTLSLVVLIWTRWGQYQPLRKCLVLSLLAHLLLAGYAATVQIVSMTPPTDGPWLRITCIEGPGGPGANGDDPSSQAAAPASPPALALASHPADAPEPAAPANPESQAPPLLEIPPQVSPPPAMPTAVLDQPIEPAKESAPAAGPTDPSKPPGPADEPAVSAADASDRVPATAPALPAQESSGGNTAQAWSVPTADNSVRSSVPPATAETPATQDHPMPGLYKLRMAPNHARLAQGRGGSPETEAAVQAALRWLAENQSPEGRWIARLHEAGRATIVDGQDRRNAGVDADSAMTGLAILAFLASGHTHRDGPHTAQVRRGLEYLLSIQAADGNLSSRADVFARMYSHAIAAFALSEAYGMTGDHRLRGPVTRAIAYTVAAQDPYGGGWRYRPGDPGDTSQLGWQLMALKSAELAGIPIPETTRQAIIRFLRSVSSGNHGGLACYRPGEQVTRTMTAEALACWQFLGMKREDPASNEAGDLLLGQLPGQGTTNVYYWYYATLAMFQLQGEHWQRWNEVMRPQLLTTQQTTGPLAGSWDPDPTWGSYGGRVYSTSLCALCLEVYYRYLPLYVQAAESQLSSPPEKR